MSNQTIIAEIDALEARRCKALIEQDIATISGIVGDDLLYVHSSAVSEDRALYLKKLADGLYRYSGLKSLRRAYRVMGDIVLADGDLEISVKVNGNDKVINSRYLQVWAKRADGWKMISWQSTLIPQS